MLGGECVFNTCVALLSQARDLQEQSHLKALTAIEMLNIK